MSSNDIFTKVPVKTPARSSFDLCHGVPLTFKMGKLVPFLMQEVLPGDTWKMRNIIFSRFMPMIAPPMHKFKVYTNYFFVPSRILWKAWQYWIAQDRRGIENVYPTLEFDRDTDKVLYYIDTLADYIGVAPYLDDPMVEPTGSNPEYKLADGTDINALPFMAYQKIYYEYFRDENLIDPDGDEPEFDWIRTDEYIPDGVHANVIPESQQFQGLVRLRTRAWKKDYFTSGLPWAQKGASINIPLGFSDVPLVNKGFPLDFEQGAVASVPGGGSPTPAGNLKYDAAGLLVNTNGDPVGSNYQDGKALTSLLQAIDGTVNNLRTAFQVQKWEELNAVGGTRHNEFLRKHFNIAPSDATLQRPRYIGGSSGYVAISEVLQTTPTTYDPEGVAEGVLADMAGHGQSAHSSKMLVYTAEEFGYMCGIVSVMPEALYWQGVAKFLWKKDVFDFAFPSFAHLGEQEILKKELLMNNNSGNILNALFAYTPRYAEYKFINSRVCGQMRKQLDFWHYGRIINPALATINLNKDFIEYSNDKRIFAVTDPEQDEIVMHIDNIIYVKRPLPKYGTPISLY